MPDTGDAGHKRSRVFDAFVAVEGGAQNPKPVTMAWTADLSSGEKLLLARLCRRISYLGRAESWAEATAIDVNYSQWDCWPDEHASSAAATTLMALAPPEALADWAKDQPTPKKGTDVPRTLWDVLTFAGERYRAEGWSGVPGTRLVRYVFADRPFRRTAVVSSAKRTFRRPTVARFAIRSAVLPRLHDAILLGERLRQSAMAQSRRVSGDARSVFSGHGAVASNHQHAMYLSSSEDSKNRERGFIDHLTVSARGGFEEEDVIALQRLRRLWGRSGHDLDLVLVGLGSASDFGGFPQPHAPMLAQSRVWESVTPFVPPRHPKKVRGVHVDTIEDQLRRGCEQLLGVTPIEISPIKDRAYWAAFRRRRPEGGGRRGPDGGFGARLVFERQVPGPIALGYGAHFGLGVFAAISDPR
jgi:CRISPR-associated protein Csb2